MYSPSTIAHYIESSKGARRTDRNDSNSRSQREDGRVHRLSQAIERDQLHVLFQPILHLETQQIVAVEALARWDDGPHGPVPPGEFIPMAEQHGLIDRLTQRIVKLSCQASRSWERQGTSVKCSVNLSPIVIASGRCVTIIERASKKYDVPVSRIVVEITESCRNLPRAVMTAELELIHRAGLACSLDDFGMGQNSFDKLLRYPLSEVKLDRSVVETASKNPADFDILSGITELAKRLGLVVTAEGIEDIEAYDTVVRAGCDRVQGYFISRPTPAAMIPTICSRYGRTAAATAGTTAKRRTLNATSSRRR